MCGPASARKHSGKSLTNIFPPTKKKEKKTAIAFQAHEKKITRKTLKSTAIMRAMQRTPQTKKNTGGWKQRSLFPHKKKKRQK
jgi:hypothetical protein